MMESLIVKMAVMNIIVDRMQCRSCSVRRLSSGNLTRDGKVEEVNVETNSNQILIFQMWRQVCEAQLEV